MKCYLGADIGTSGCRVVAYREDFVVLAEAIREYPVISPYTGWAEQDPEVILAELAGAFAQVLAHPALEGREPEAIGLASQMHSLIALDQEGKPLTNAVIWADLRSAREAAGLKARGLGAEFYQRTGCPIHPMYLPAKTLWLREQAPDIWSRIRRIVTIKDYVIWRLTGIYVLDQSSASATGLLNLRTLRWDDSVLNAIGLEPGMLSEPVHPLTRLEGFTTPYARTSGLPANVQLVIGATDGTLSNPGAGVLRPGQMAVMIGTSAAVRVTSPEPVLDPQQRTWCYNLLPDTWIPGGAANNGGNILQWYRDRLGAAETAAVRAQGGNPYEALSRRAGAVPPGSRGLISLPFLAGERSPGWDPDARGVLFGLSLTHGSDEIIRALMEGVAYQLYGIYEALSETTGVPVEVRATGGFTKSPTWLQIVADVLGVPLHVPAVSEGSAFGAATLAMLAAGQLTSLHQACERIRVTDTIEPNPAHTEVYREIYGMYQNLYRKLGPDFADVAAFQNTR